MKNKIEDLNNHLFAQLERLGEEGMSENKIKTELMRTKAIVGVSKQLIDSGKLSVQAHKAMAETGDTKKKINMPLLVGVKAIPVLKADEDK